MRLALRLSKCLRYFPCFNYLRASQFNWPRSGRKMQPNARVEGHERLRHDGELIVSDTRHQQSVARAVPLHP